MQIYLKLALSQTINSLLISALASTGKSKEIFLNFGKHEVIKVECRQIFYLHIDKLLAFIHQSITRSSICNTASMRAFCIIRLLANQWMYNLKYSITCLSTCCCCPSSFYSSLFFLLLGPCFS